MKILVIPDIHGRTFWKEPAFRLVEKVDRVVFLGDYLDPYGNEVGDFRPDSIYVNLLEVLRLKIEYPEKVVLLKGNHDQHYASKWFRMVGAGSRLDRLYWNKYHDLFQKYFNLFQLAYLEQVGKVPYLFTHAGVTAFWLSQVNRELWHLDEDAISLDDAEVVQKLNELDFSNAGQDILAIVGKSRSVLGGSESGSMLWADVDDHQPSQKFGLDRVFQVFGHTRLKEEDMVKGEHFAMIDSRQCFLIDSDRKEQIAPLHE